MWRVCTLHLDNVHATKKHDARQTLPYFLFLMMRDNVDIITGYFNQGAKVLGEVMTHVVAFTEAEGRVDIEWFMPEPHEEIRTIFINWPAYTDTQLSGPKENLKMMVKPMRTFEHCTVEDVGMHVVDHDSHTPSFYVIRKSHNLDHDDLHQRSEAGKKRDTERRKEKKREKKRARIQ